MPNEDRDAGLNVEEPVPAGMKKVTCLLILHFPENLMFKYIYISYITYMYIK